MAILRKSERPTATMQAAYTMCQFANGREMCTCCNKKTLPCQATLAPARLLIDAAKKELAEIYVLRKRPINRKEQK